MEILVKTIENITTNMYELYKITEYKVFMVNIDFFFYTIYTLK